MYKLHGLDMYAAFIGRAYTVGFFHVRMIHEIREISIIRLHLMSVKSFFWAVRSIRSLLSIPVESRISFAMEKDHYFFVSSSPLDSSTAASWIASAFSMAAISSFEASTSSDPRCSRMGRSTVPSSAFHVPDVGLCNTFRRPSSSGADDFQAPEVGDCSAAAAAGGSSALLVVSTVLSPPAPAAAAASFSLASFAPWTFALRVSRRASLAFFAFSSAFMAACSAMLGPAGAAGAGAFLAVVVLAAAPPSFFSGSGGAAGIGAGVPPWPSDLCVEGPVGCEGPEALVGAVGLP